VDRLRNFPTYDYHAVVYHFSSSPAFSDLSVSFVCSVVPIMKIMLEHGHCYELLVTKRGDDYCFAFVCKRASSNSMKLFYN